MSSVPDLAMYLVRGMLMESCSAKSSVQVKPKEPDLVRDSVEDYLREPSWERYLVPAKARVSGLATS